MKIIYGKYFKHLKMDAFIDDSIMLKILNLIA